MLITNTACHLVMGFLGSGKTSFINACIQAFKAEQKWAILVNEAGQIGIDEKLFANPTSQNANDDPNANDSGLAIRQVAGGCICCTSQLPLQIALVRLISEQKPDRLWIEPTGLAHPKELIEQLSAPHWQTTLALKSAISIVNARHWLEPRYREHEGYQSHVRFCDVIVVNRFDSLDDSQRQQLTEWLTANNPTATIIWQQGLTFDEATKSALLSALASPSQVLANRQHYRQVSLASFSQPRPTAIGNLAQAEAEPIDEPALPFRYHDIQNSYQIMGWRLPNEWTVVMVTLMDWLLKLPNWQRIKAVIHTAPNGVSDWQTLNFTPDSLDIASTEPQVDNRIEVIFLDADIELDFEVLDRELMAFFQQNEN
ncbi:MULTISPECIES: CobW family GTP-binding protein [unclassified Moraxella]|uniref:CobW family GTP-binding protein n=1 Tax=unclassified Moraxella TaxID=2685852 RepID=UPI003AF4523A